MKTFFLSFYIKPDKANKTDGCVPNPEAKRVLTYINSQIQWMGYSEALDFIRGDKR